MMGMAQRADGQTGNTSANQDANAVERGESQQPSLSEEVGEAAKQETRFRSRA